MSDSSTHVHPLFQTHQGFDTQQQEEEDETQRDDTNSDLQNNDYRLSFKQLEEKRSGDVEVMIESKNSKELESQNGASSHTARLNLDHPEGSFAILEHERNKQTNPHREATNTLPVLIRRTESVEILPWPFRTTLQLIVCTYATCCCCLACGVFATTAAVKTKDLRNKGLYEVASRYARKACYLMLAAVICGSVIIIIMGTVLGVEIPKSNRNRSN